MIVVMYKTKQQSEHLFSESDPFGNTLKLIRLYTDKKKTIV